jgi:hypothetical protein
VTRERQLGLEDALRITHEVAAALGHAHARGRRCRTRSRAGPIPRARGGGNCSTSADLTPA